MADSEELIASLKHRVDDYEQRFRLLDGHIRVLERERQKLSAVVNNTDAGFLVLDSALRLVWANHHLSSIFGARFQQGSLLGAKCHKVLCGREEVCEICPAAQAFRSGLVAHHEIRLEMEGQQRHLYATSMPIKSPDGAIEETIVMLQDVSDLKVLRKSQEALRASEERFRSIFEKVAAGMATVAPDGSFLQVNPSFCSFLGYSEAELLELKVTDVTHPEDLEATRAVFSMASTGSPETVQMEKRFLGKDGRTLWGFTTAVWLFDPRMKPLYAVALVQDIGERKQAEQALRQSEEQLRHAQKMEAVGRLAGGVAHDFNNLLTVIKGRCDMLGRQLGEESPLGTQIEEIRRAGERAASLTRQLLAFSRKQVLQPRVIDLNAAVVEVEKMLRRLIGEDIDLVTILSPGRQTVKADPGQIEQVLMNLAVNSRDAMPEGGQITLETAQVHLDESFDGQNVAIQPGRFVMLAVGDTGSGIPAEIFSHIFEPFFTTKEQGKGTGLGLSTVYGIVRQSGGHVRVESQPGRGTTFRIYLPCVEDPIAAVAKADTVAASLAGTETILLVEDEAVVRNLVRDLLRASGYTVLEAHDPGDARLLCERHQGRIHMMLTDVVMPLMSGTELAAYLAPIRPDMKVLYMSGYTESRPPIHDNPDALITFLQKPFAPCDLMSRVRELLDTPGQP